jgi:hypothetical protein
MVLCIKLFVRKHNKIYDRIGLFYCSAKQLLSIPQIALVFISEYAEIMMTWNLLMNRELNIGM